MKKRYTAVLTVEAAIVMPVIISVVLLLLQYSLSLYDRVVSRNLLRAELEALVADINGRDSNGYDFNALADIRSVLLSDEQKISRAVQNLERSIKGALLFSKVSSVKFEKTLTGIVGKINVKHNQMLPILAKLQVSSTVFAGEECRNPDRVNKTRIAAVFLDALAGYVLDVEE